MNHFDFSGTNARLAKRRALNYWYNNRNRLGMTMGQFFERCRLREESGLASIRFYPEEVA